NGSLSPARRQRLLARREAPRLEGLRAATARCRSRAARARERRRRPLSQEPLYLGADSARQRRTRRGARARRRAAAATSAPMAITEPSVPRGDRVARLHPPPRPDARAEEPRGSPDGVRVLESLAALALLTLPLLASRPAGAGAD